VYFIKIVRQLHCALSGNVELCGQGGKSAKNASCVRAWLSG